MLIESFLHTRSDRLIALGRMAIAAFALAAVWVDPSQPTVAPALTYGLLAGYFAFALAVVLASQRETVHTVAVAVGAHLIDLATFSTLMFLTEGATSPFFLLFTFSLLSATFRWQWKGALWTAVAVIALLIVIAAAYRLMAPGLNFEVDRFIIRCAHVVVIGAMLVYFGFRQQHSAEEATRFAAWQPEPTAEADSRSLLSVCLAHVANVFAAPRAVLVLQGLTEPSASISAWEHGRFQHVRLTGDTLESIVPKGLAEAAFIRRATGEVLIAEGHGSVSLWRDSSLSPWLTEHGLERVLSVLIRSEQATGRLFVAANQDFTRGELTIASLVAAKIGNLLDRLQIIERAQQAAATEERLRLARDLHDGILQTLSATALQLEAIKALTDSDPASAQSRINDMQSWLRSEQRELRGFISQLQPPSPAGQSAELALDLATLIESLEQQWGVAITLSADVENLLFPADIEFHLRQIIREAVANAVRHGGATRIRLQANINEGRLNLMISDNGKGLPVHGKFDESQSAQSRMGPRSLRERIVSLGGSQVLESRPDGLTLAIELPLRNTNAADDPADCR